MHASDQSSHIDEVAVLTIKNPPFVQEDVTFTENQPLSEAVKSDTALSGESNSNQEDTDLKGGSFSEAAKGSFSHWQRPKSDENIEEVEVAVKESSLNDADAASTCGRPSGFVPFSNHVHDLSVLRSVLDQLMSDVPKSEKETEVYRGLELRQTANNSAVSFYDCLGMNQETYSGGVIPEREKEKTTGGGIGTVNFLNATHNLPTQTTPLPPQPVQHVGEESVIYPCGRHLTVTHLEDSSSRRIVHTPEKVLGIVALVVSNDGKYLAVSERYTDHNAISIYRVDSGAKVSTLDYKMVARSLVSELHFSSNNRYLVTITAQPEHKLILWLLDEMRIVGLCEDLSRTPIHKIRFSGWCSSTLASVSPDRLLLWNYLDRDVTAIDVLAYHEERIELLRKQNYHDVYGYKKGEVPPATRIQSSSVSQVALFAGDAEKRANPGFVSVEWYEDKCYAALTEDGWFLTIEDDLRIRMCVKIHVPDRDFTVVESLSRVPSISPQNGETSRPSLVSPTPISVSHRSSTSANQALFQEPDINETGDAVRATLSTLRSMTTPQRRLSTAATHNAEKKQGLSDSKKHPHIHLSTIFSKMSWCSRGLIVVAPRGWLTLMDRTYDDSNPFLQLANISVCPSDHCILSLSVSPGETNLVMALSTNQLSYISLATLDDAIDTARTCDMKNTIPFDASSLPAADVSRVLSGATQKSSSFHHAKEFGKDTAQGLFEEGITNCVDLNGELLVKAMVHTRFHQSTVTSVSIALQRPYMATSATDGTVLVYDYLRRKLVSNHKFSDTVLSCALHPMGTQIIVCESFTTGLYAVLDTGLVLLTVVGVRGAQFARFSNNGGRIAFAVSNRVVLFNSATLESVGMLIGHSNNVKGVRWCDNDERLVTCDASGAFLGWNAFTCKRVGPENSHRNVILSGVCGMPQEGAFAAVGTTRHTRGAVLENEFTIIGITPFVQGVVYLRPGMIYPRSAVSRRFHTGLVCYSEISKTLFVGTPSGRIFLYSWPLIRTSKPYSVIDAHEGEILHMILSHDEQFLFTICADNLCFIFQLQHMKEGRYMAIPSFDYNITDPVKLVGADVQQRNIGAEVEVLNEMIRFKIEDTAVAKRNLSRLHDDKCKEIVRDAQKKISLLKSEIQKTKDECKSLIEKGQQERKQADSNFQITAEAIENQYGRLTEAYAAKMNSLKASSDQLLISFETTHSAMLKRWDETKVSMEAGRLEKERQLAGELQRLQQEIRTRSKDADAMIDQTIIDGEREICRTQAECARVLQETLDAIQRVGHVQSFGEREAERLRKEIAGHKEELVAKSMIQAELERQTVQNAQRNTTHRQNNKSRQEEINVAEKNLQQLRQQLTSLENLRFVLIHQFEQLQSEMEPKEAKIRQLERAIAEREGLLSHVHRERNDLKEQVQSTNARLQGANELSHKTMMEKQAKVYALASVISKLSKAVDEFNGDTTTALRAFKEILNEKQMLPYIPNMINSVSSNSSGKKSTKFKIPEIRSSSLNKESLGIDAKAKSELDRQAHFLECQHSSFLNSMRERVTIAESLHQSYRHENEKYLKDIRQLQEERKAQAETLKNLEAQLRDIRTEIHLASSQSQRKELGGSERKVQSCILPSLNGKRSGEVFVNSKAHRSFSCVSATPAPTRGKTLSMSLDASPGILVRKEGGTRQPSKGLPPIRNLSQSLPVKISGVDQGQSDTNLTCELENEDDDPTFSSKKVGTHRSAKERLMQREQLRLLIEQLDNNTDVMRSQQQTINRLRNYVKELLATEEDSVVRQVGQRITGEVTVAATGNLQTAATSSPIMLQIGDETHLPNLNTRSPIKLSSLTRSPQLVTLGEDTPPTYNTEESNDLIDNEEVDWTGQQARPMTPVLKPH